MHTYWLLAYIFVMLLPFYVIGWFLLATIARFCAYYITCLEDMRQLQHYAVHGKLKSTEEERH